ncbi:SIR2 family protein [Gryllotalpicola reticulitermitis]|uniref:SIR2 family protein n=1 Tax=Gryllotalpicola reticulitermitis TaxID=1184153 RepID=A0ABV8Q655_9MICO
MLGHVNPRRVAVLLGAGASADAGIPLTSELAEKVVGAANAEAGVAQPWVRALNFVYGAMVGYQAEAGGNPLGAVNIERLISAVRLLQARDTHEAAPFVAAWKDGAFAFGSTPYDALIDRRVTAAISNSHLRVGNHALIEAISAVARRAVHPDSAPIFRQVERHVLQGIRTALCAPSRVDYLEPLLQLAREQDGGLDVVTLNYDLLVETLAADADDVSVDTGIARWRPGQRLTFDPAPGKVNLLKLHGSLSWANDHSESSEWSVNAPVIREVPDGVQSDGSGSSSREQKLPWIVVGDREKLSTDGPTLALLRAAEDVLDRASHLVIVGYSFGDRHINSMIRDWMLASESRTMTVLDLYWPDRKGVPDARSEFLEQYLERVGGRQQKRTPRILPLRGTARDRLAAALSAVPEPDPEPYVDVQMTGRWPDIILKLTNLGPELEMVTVNGALPGARRSGNLSIYTSAEERTADTQPKALASGARLSGLVPGEPRYVYPWFPRGEREVMFNIGGHSLTGDRLWTFSFQVEGA